tara:strand:+ start:1274 stop:4411 length:3138 start_codon:yes stop_codon:yes gene_type:complete
MGDELNLTQLSTKELLELLNEKNPNSLINNTEIDTPVALSDFSDQQLLTLVNEKKQDKKMDDLRAKNPTEFFINSSKLGLGDATAFAGTLIDAQKSPFKHLLEKLYFGSEDNNKLQKEKENAMRNKLNSFKNSDEYDELLANGQTDRIEDKINEITLEGGTRGLHWKEMIDSISLPDIPFTKDATYYDTFVNNLNKNQEIVSKVTTSDHRMLSSSGTIGEEAVGMAIRFASDPTFYIPGGQIGSIKKLGSLNPLIGDDLLPLAKEAVKKLSARFFKNGTTASAMGVGTVLGSEGGGKLEEKFTGKDTGIGRTIGSFVGGIGFGTLQIPTKYAFKKLEQTYKNRQFAKKYPDEVAKQYAAGGVKEIFKLMQNELNPERLDLLISEFRKVGSMLQTHEIPLLVMAADSPTAQAELKRLMQTNPGFRTQVEDEVYKLGIALDRHADAIFGTRYAPVELSTLPETLRAQGDQLIKLRMELDKKIELLDLSFVPQNADDIGNQVKAIVIKREKAARKEMKPVYTAIDNEAKLNNIVLPGRASTELYDFVTANNLADLFGKNTPIDNMITAYLKPKKNKELVMVDQVNADMSVIKVERMRGDLRPSHPEYQAPVSMDLSWTQMDSLKRAINQFGRENLTQTERRKLNQFKTFFKEKRLEMVGTEKSGLRFDNTIAMKLNANLDAADVLYYEKIGIPYSQEGILQINSKKYATEIAPVLFKNSESLNQFLSVSGKEGIEIAQNAYLLQMYDKVMKDGVFDVKKVQILMRRDRRILESLPGIKKILEKSIVDQSELMLKRHAINNAAKDFEKEIADHFLISSALSPSYPDLAKRLVKGDLGFYNKIQNDLKLLDSSSARIVNDNIKREYVTQIFEQGNKKNGGMRYLLDPANEKMLNTLFDKEQINIFKKLSMVSDNLKKIDIADLNAKSVAQQVDPIQKILPGVTTQYGASQIRDRVSSVGMKVIRVVTHINQAKLQSKLDHAVQEMLLHPDIKKLNVWGNRNKWKITSGNFETLKNIIAEMIPNYIHGATETRILQEFEKENTERIKGETK